jgi:hypothetical protein
VSAESLRGQLVLRHASKRSSGTWGPDDYDVIDAEGRDVGRIFKTRAGAPEDLPCMWAITGAVVMPALPSHGFCASLDEAKAKFAETWRRDAECDGSTAPRRAPVRARSRLGTGPMMGTGS